MFGPDTALVLDALQIAAIVAAGSGGLVFLAMKRRSPNPATKKGARGAKNDLEERVRVLERIATDRPSDLAEQIEALRTPEQSLSQGGNA